jgi:hypothetical protein
LSKYIHVTSCFEVFITTNLMVQSEFNLVLWFVSYNIFKLVKIVARTSRGRRATVHARYPPFTIRLDSARNSVRAFRVVG